MYDISRAFFGPTSQHHIVLISPPPSGSEGQRMRQSSATRVMSQQIASMVAPAMQKPCTWATIGLGNS